MPMKQKNTWPYWAHKSEREWKRDARKRWVEFRKAFDKARVGCKYYPDEVYNFMQGFKDADNAMRNFYNKA